MVFRQSMLLTKCEITFALESIDTNLFVTGEAFILVFLRNRTKDTVRDML